MAEMSRNQADRLLVEALLFEIDYTLPWYPLDKGIPESVLDLIRVEVAPKGYELVRLSEEEWYLSRM